MFLLATVDLRMVLAVDQRLKTMTTFVILKQPLKLHQDQLQLAIISFNYSVLLQIIPPACKILGIFAITYMISHNATSLQAKLPLA
jgi:hypothetical protein